MKSMQLGKSICEIWANLLFNEKVLISIEDETTKEFVYKVFDDNNFWIKLNEMQEMKMALGTVCYIPYVEGMYVAEDGNVLKAEGITMSYITAENLRPLSYKNGVINELAVASEFSIDRENFAYIQLFVLNSDRTYRIENKVIKLMQNSYQVMTLSSIPGFQSVAPIVQTGSELKPFIIDKPNLFNNINKNSPMGISTFANSIDTMKMLDIVFDSLTNEFIVGKKRIMVSKEAIEMKDGEPTFDDKDVVFYQLDRKPGDKEQLIKEIDMKLRAGDHASSIQMGLNVFSSQNGLGENYYRLDGTSVTTATQVISEQGTLFRTLKKHEIILDGVLVDLIRLIIMLGKNYLKLPLDEFTEIKIRFDDSIIEDTDAQQKRDLNWVNNDIMSKLEFRMKWFGETEEEALEALNKVTMLSVEQPQET